jgi:S1-C subfamily serine protease
LAALAALVAVGFAGSGAAKPRAVEYTRSVFRMEEGVVWGHVSGGANCNIDLEQIHWTREGAEIHTERLGAAFHQALVDVGAAPEDENLFAETAPAADLQVAAALGDLHASICEQSGLYGYRGSLSMTVQWQVYDPAARRLVGKFETHATGQTSQATTGGLDALFLAAFRANARDLMSDPGFQKILKAPAGAASGAAAAGGLDTAQTIAFAPASASAPKTPPQAVQSVVLVQTGDGHGSGFLISPQGYVLTNHHVVGSSRVVRVRWADGTEGPAQVVRVNRERDIALLKVEPPTPAAALAVRVNVPAQGETVFAIGAPLDPSLQGTLTRGVVSANRVVGSLPFIQSDVAITHGNSGGPLLNERGEVVGVSELGYLENGASVSLNMFIPIGDALRALSMAPAPPARPIEPTPLKRRKAPKP